MDAGAGGPDHRLAFLRGRRAVVLGLGVSNLAVIDCLLRAGARVTAADQKTASELGERYEALRRLPVRLALGPGYLGALEGQQIAFLTPGLRRDLGELEQARRAGVEFSSEVKLLFQLCRAPIVAVTGSAGKTTTTTLVGLMLGRSRPGVWVGGNIGRPLVRDVLDVAPEDLVVLELSSFQLQDLGLSPWIGAVLNVSPNHLDMHPTMEAYVEVKRTIYRHQGPGDFCVFNYDCPWTRDMARDYDRTVRAGRGGSPPVVYSRLGETGDGAFLRGEELVLRLGAYGAGLPDGAVCRKDEIRLLGEHNLENVLAAAAVAGLAGACLEAMREVATTFRGVEHRLEPVREVGGVRYYNDSIGTAPDRTIAALRALPGPLVLILGGYDKKIGFEGLAREVVECGRVRAAVLCGATAGKIEAALRGEAAVAGPLPRLERAERFEEAVRRASELARPGDIVLLSPACASFDQFANFEERGRAFKQLVHALPESGERAEGPQGTPGAGV